MLGSSVSHAVSCSFLRRKRQPTGAAPWVRAKRGRVPRRGAASGPGGESRNALDSKQRFVVPFRIASSDAVASQGLDLASRLLVRVMRQTDQDPNPKLQKH